MEPNYREGAAFGPLVGGKRGNNSAPNCQVLSLIDADRAAIIRRHERARARPPARFALSLLHVAPFARIYNR